MWGETVDTSDIQVYSCLEHYRRVCSLGDYSSRVVWTTTVGCVIWATIAITGRLVSLNRISRFKVCLCRQIFQ